MLDFFRIVADEGVCDAISNLVFSKHESSSDQHQLSKSGECGGGGEKLIQMYTDRPHQSPNKMHPPSSLIEPRPMPDPNQRESAVQTDVQLQTMITAVQHQILQVVPCCTYYTSLTGLDIVNMI